MSAPGNRPPAGNPPGGVELARELWLLGAESTVSLPSGEVSDGHRGWPHVRSRWDALGERVAAQAVTPHDPLGGRAEELGLSTAARWILYLCAAVELYPDAAAAASIVAEDERVHLGTPLGCARLLRAADCTPYRVALREALPGCALERFGLLERAGAPPARPHSQAPVRLSPAALGLLLGSRDLGAPGTGRRRMLWPACCQKSARLLWRLTRPGRGRI